MKKLLLFFCFVASSALNAMEHSKISLDALPAEVVANILEEIVDTAGTPAICNDEDIPVIARYIKGLSLVNKNLYKKINDPLVTSTILYRLHKRFGISMLDAAAYLKNPGAIRWVEQVAVPQEYELFKGVQKILGIIDETAAEFREKYDFGIDNGQKGWPGCNPYYNQIKNGLMVAVEMTPNELHTPWGQVRIAGGGSGSGSNFKAFTLAVLKRLRTTVAYVPRVSQSSRDNLQLYEIHQRDIRNQLDANQPIDWDSMRTPISADNAAKKIGTDTLLESNLSGYPCVYAIHEIDGQPLPTPLFLSDSEQERSYKATKLIWDVLDKKYKEELGGTEYTTAKEKTDKIFKRTPTKEIKKEEDYPLQSVHNLSEWAVSLLKKCSTAPKRQSLLGAVPHTLSAKNDDDGMLLERMVKSHRKEFTISHDRHDSSIKLYGDVSDECLKSANFEAIVTEIRTGWQAAQLVNFPDIFHQHSEADYYLYIKKSAIDIGELLCLVASKLGMRLHHDFHIGNTWKDSIKGYKSTDSFYLWIKKEKLDEVRAKLDLVLS